MFYLLIGFTLAGILVSDGSLSVSKNPLKLLFIVIGWILLIPILVITLLAILVLHLLKGIEKK
jgi:hypothetical protein